MKKKKQKSKNDEVYNNQTVNNYGSKFCTIKLVRKIMDGWYIFFLN